MAYATQEAVDGKHWPGYKLVAGRTVRKYTSEAEVIKAATEAGCTDIYKTTLLGVGDLEKRLGRKKFSEVLGKYIRANAGLYCAQTGNGALRFCGHHLSVL